jgi:L,D-transpeptidase ErfK/SrfK
MKIKLRIGLSAALLLITAEVFATAYTIPPAQESLIGQVKYGYAAWGETAATVAERYDLGFNALQKANPHLRFERALPKGAALTLPTQHLLPNQAREGIVINLPEMRMYYYLPKNNQVLTFPIGIGQIGKNIPIEKTAITKKTKNPYWIPPDDIREFNLKTNGIVLPQIVPPGPDNPLGPYAIYMTIPTYLIHSTIFPESIGKRASFGCVRMYESDIKQFFPIVEKGIPVAIINTPVKVGWQDDRLYMEAYVPLEEHTTAFDASLPGMVKAIDSASQNQSILVDWQAVAYIDKERDGVPHDIGMKIKQGS